MDKCFKCLKHEKAAELKFSCTIISWTTSWLTRMAHVRVDTHEECAFLSMRNGIDVRISSSFANAEQAEKASVSITWASSNRQENRDISLFSTNTHAVPDESMFRLTPAVNRTPRRKKIKYTKVVSVRCRREEDILLFVCASEIWKVEEAMAWGIFPCVRLFMCMDCISCVGGVRIGHCKDFPRALDQSRRISKKRVRFE